MCETPGLRSCLGIWTSNSNPGSETLHMATYMSKTSAIYHIVINTIYRKKTIDEKNKKELYKYIYGIIQNNSSTLLRINGIGNHIHILLDLHPSISLATLVQKIKQSSSRWLRENPNFPLFEGWGKEYFAFSYHQSQIPTVKQYIINQEEHHRFHPFEEELQNFCKENGIEWNDFLLT